MGLNVYHLFSNSNHSYKGEIKGVVLGEKLFIKEAELCAVVLVLIVR
jgi:hypothetical protein